MDSFYKSPWFIVPAIAIVFIGILANKSGVGNTDDAEDLFFLFSDSKTVAEGGNPYLRTADGNMHDNEKYTTYFPLFFLTNAVLIKAGFSDYYKWQVIWQVVMLISLFATAFLVFHMIRKKANWQVALLAVLFILFNRWTLYVTLISQIDFTAILFLILSFFYLDSSFKKSLLFFGLSLAFKQMAIFLAPLYLIWAWQKNPSSKYLWQSTFWAGIIPFVTSLPFLIWDAKSYLMSILFSATRGQATHMDASALNFHLKMGGLVGKLPMLLLMAFIFYLTAKNKIGRFTSAFLVMTIFMTFNAVLLNQYLAWTAVLLPLVFIDYYDVLNRRKEIT